MALLLAGSVFTACKKKTFATRPSLTFKKVNSYTIPNRGVLEITLEYTDAEGDLSTKDSSITIQRIVPRCANSNGLYPYKLPAVPLQRNASGEVVIQFANNVSVADLPAGYGSLPGPRCGRPDTTTFKFWIKDQQGNVSDTITTDKPIIILN